MAFPEVTLERVQQWTQQQDLSVDVDEDGDIRCAFDEVVMFIHCKENLLRVQGYWRGRFNPEEDGARVVEVANRFNSQALMPKSIPVPGRGIVVFEHSAYTGAGLSDEQLANLMSNAYASIFKAVETFEENLPDLIESKDN